MTKRIGIDLGGTKIEAIVLDENHTPLKRKRVSTPKDYPGILSEITKLVKELHVVAPQATIGLGCPGHVGIDGKIRNSNTQCLNGKSLKLDLENRLAQSVSIENDANCFALAEAQLGAGKNDQTVFGVILGTGVGGGIVINQQLLSGKHHIAGEWGHNVLEAEGPDCYCGKQGCVETLLSGSGMALEFNTQNDTAYSAKEIFHLSEDGNKSALSTRDCYVDRLAIALSVVINIIDPDCIVLGGGISNVDYLYSGALNEKLKGYVFHPNWQGKVLKNEQGDSAGVIGAALL